MSVVVPAYNEEERLSGMLEEAVAFLQDAYGDAHGPKTEEKQPSQSAHKRRASIKEAVSNGSSNGSTNQHVGRGWEIIIVSDGSTDKTVQTALKFARDHQLSEYPVPVPGPRTPKPVRSTNIPHGSVRVVELAQNRGKGGAVTHGMRHVRGQFTVFADADGASRFEDLAALVQGAQEVQDHRGRAVAIGSRAHLVGSEAVVKVCLDLTLPLTVRDADDLQRSALRNFLMYSFHLLIWLMTPPATSRIKDTQCGFKLFSRTALPHIVPYMHCEGWIFDVEQLMLAESAKVPVAEIAIGWKEVKGSKLNVIKDSINMAWGLLLLRLAWALGVYKRR